MRQTMKQRRAALRNLRKARAALRRKGRRRNPVAGSKGRWHLRRRQLARRRSVAKRQRRKLKGVRVIVRRVKGKRKMNKKWGRRHGVRTGRKGTISYRRKGRLLATNPSKRRRGKRRSYRRNPISRAASRTLSVQNWTQGLTKLPSNLGDLFKGKVVPKVVLATGGAVGGIVLGGMARGAIMGALAKVAPGIVSNRIVQGILGGAITYSGGYIVGSMLFKGEKKTAIVTGAALAAVVNALMPGQVNRLLTAIPVIGPQLAMLPGMEGYVMAPSYQGVGAYVSAPGYQGVGALPSDALAGIGYDDALAGDLGAYVSAPGYQGVGMYGESHLDQ